MKTLILILFTMSASAQFTIITEVGTTSSGLGHDIPCKSSLLTSPTIGLSISKQFSQTWSRGFGAKWLSRGVKVEGERLLFDYLDLSIILTKKLDRVSFDGNMTASYLLRRKWNNEFPNNLRIADFTLELGVNVLITNDVHATVRYSQGVVNMSTTKIKDIDFGKHNVLTIAISKHFFTKAKALVPRI